MKLPEYRSIEEKRPKFCYVKIDTKDVLDNHLNHLLVDNSHCIFRGVREARYKLFTSVQREWITNGLGRHMTINQLVNSLIRDMRQNRALNDYFALMNIVQTDFLYLSLLQHYSAPTPLLDFTHNHRVALYFATAGLTTAYTENDIDDYFSLYYIDWDESEKLLSKMDKQLDGALKTGKDFYEKFLKKNPNIQVDNSLLDDLDRLTKWETTLSLYSLTFINNPQEAQVTTPYAQNTLYWSNLNIIAQEGCFLLYNQEDTPLEDYLNNNILYCLDIHKSLADYIRTHYLSGITQETLFPNITQIAQQAYTNFKEKL